MHRSTHTPIALILILLVAVFVVLFADVFAVSAAADPLPAVSGAVLTPVSPSTLSRPYSHSSFRATSRLLDAAGQPIAGARIDILQRTAGSSQMQLVGSAITRPDGTFTALVPAGPSRLVDLAYRSPSGAGGYVAQTEVLENVTAGLRLRITPRRTTPTGTVRFEGRVLGRHMALLSKCLSTTSGNGSPFALPAPRTRGECSSPIGSTMPPGSSRSGCEFATGRLGSLTRKPARDGWR
jgi:hypothetical protein